MVILYHKNNESFPYGVERGIQDYVIANTVYFVVAIPHTHAGYIFLKSFSDQRNR
ncbi:MAG: hypothetical protein ACRD6U_12305 [Nitrososphaeraceae archaeon]